MIEESGQRSDADTQKNTDIVFYVFQITADRKKDRRDRFVG
jgi:hypothetical protein